MPFFSSEDAVAPSVILSYCDISGAGLRAAFSSSLSVSPNPVSVSTSSLSLSSSLSSLFPQLIRLYEGHDLLEVTNYFGRSSENDTTIENQGNISTGKDLSDQPSSPLFTTITFNCLIPEDLTIDLAHLLLCELRAKGVENIQVLTSQALKDVSLHVPEKKELGENEKLLDENDRTNTKIAKNKNDAMEQVYIASNASASTINKLYSSSIYSRINNLPATTLTNNSNNDNGFDNDAINNNLVNISDRFPLLEGTTKLYDPFVGALISIGRIEEINVIVFTCYGYKMRVVDMEEDETDKAIRALGQVLEMITQNLLHFQYLTVTTLKPLHSLASLFSPQVTLESIFNAKPSLDHSSWTRNDGFRTHL